MKKFQYQFAATKFFRFAVTALFATNAIAENGELNEAFCQQLVGRWQGTLEGSLLVQPVSWRFEVNEEGQLRGYMGPRSQGRPQVRMRNLVVSESELSFDIPKQHASFRGAFVNGAVVGKWRQGLSADLIMQKKEFVFATTPALQKTLQGEWEGRAGRTRVVLSFQAHGDSAVSGNVSVPSRDLNNMPMIDVFSDEENLLVFYTDTNRAFSGKVDGAKITGSYRAGALNYRSVTFTNISQLAYSHNLDVDSETKAALLGEWSGFSSVEFHFSINENNELGGLIRVNGRYSAVESVVVKGDSVEIRTENQRSFSGNLVEGKLVGRYRYPGASASVTFSR